ncbi:MAG: RecQ family zinc-binding domain-containing protein [Saprospiraceae bacterium]|nr:RecQ family zinc-binding domain-containing protein [Saprospiraceae bacterium]
MALETDISRIGFLLKVLHQEGIVDYLPSQEFPEIVLLLDRPNDNDFRIDELAYEALKTVAGKRLMAMQQYFLAPKCRQMMLLEYFGEKAQSCGICDVCLGSQEISYTVEEKRMALISIQKLQAGTKVGQWLTSWPLNRRKRMQQCLEDLNSEGFIEVDAGGRIYLKSQSR